MNNKTIRLQDGYNGDTIECDREPIEVDGDLVKLRITGTKMVRFCYLDIYLKELGKCALENK